MSRGKNLQEMETGTSQSKTAVNANASAPASPEKSATPVATPGQTGAWEDLGGPTPENSKPDDNSNMLKTPGATLKQVKDVVNAKASAPDAAATSATPVSTPGQGGGMKEEVEEDEEIVAEEGEEVSEVEETEEEEVVEEDVDSIIDEDVNALLSGEEELSEEFREKAKLVFEAALHAKTKEIQSALEEHYAVALAEEIEEIKLELTERVDSYLEYVASEWLEENALAVESGLKTEITESFIAGMKGLFEEHYVSMPEEKYDVLESMVEKLDEMETKLNEQIQRNVALNAKLAESAADRILNQVSEGLALSQKDKFASLAESVEFESENDYYQKLVTLRESYFQRNAGIPANETENLSEEANFQEVNHSPSMDAYLRALSTVAKK
jgi:ribosome-binding protein aMBF1 (putative translation factor)